MAIGLSDSEISDLISEPKPVRKIEFPLKMRKKGAHKEYELEVQGVNGSLFVLKVRQSIYNLYDFSAILVYHIPTTSSAIRLRRYNGSSHQHTNRLEKVTIDGFHIHQATERYQLANLPADSYAESTDRYYDLKTALDCLFADCAFVLPEDPQMSLI